MAEFIALVLIEVLLSVALFAGTVGSSAWAETDSSKALVISNILVFSWFLKGSAEQSDQHEKRVVTSQSPFWASKNKPLERCLNNNENNE